MHLVAIKAGVFDWSLEPTFLGAILVFELAAAPIQAAMDSVLIVLQYKAARVIFP